MEEIKILVVEDELLTAERMRIVLEKEGYKITDIARSGSEAINAMEKEKADLILMDIHLNGKIEGIITTKTIKELYNVSVIYITHLKDEHVFQNAKETFPKNYISKPFTNATLLQAVELAIQQPEFLSMRINEIKRALFLGDDFIDFNDILYIQTIEKRPNYLSIVRVNATNPVECKMTLNDVQSKLPKKFIRIHASTIINADKVGGKHGDFSEIIIVGKTLKVGITYRDFVKRYFYSISFIK